MTKKKKAAQAEGGLWNGQELPDVSTIMSQVKKKYLVADVQKLGFKYLEVKWKITTQYEELPRTPSTYP